MDGERRRHFSSAHVVAMLAFFIAVGGTATAVNTAIKRNSVGAKQLKRNAIRGQHLKKNQIRTKHLRDGAVTKVKLAGNAGIQGPPGPPGPPGGSGSGGGAGELRAWARVSDTIGGDPTASGGGAGGDNEGVAAVNDGPSHIGGHYCFEFEQAFDPELILVTQTGPAPGNIVEFLAHNPALGGVCPSADVSVAAVDDTFTVVDGAHFYVAFYDLK